MDVKERIKFYNNHFNKEVKAKPCKICTHPCKDEQCSGCGVSTYLCAYFAMWRNVKQA